MPAAFWAAILGELCHQKYQISNESHETHGQIESEIVKFNFPERIQWRLCMKYKLVLFNEIRLNCSYFLLWDLVGAWEVNCVV